TGSLMAAAAFAAGIAIALPVVAVSAADDAPRFAQAVPDAANRGMAMGAMGHHPGMAGMMHRMMQLPPRQRCEERLARRAGFVAYMAARPNLTAEPKPLADKVQSLNQAGRDKEPQTCAT